MDTDVVTGVDLAAYAAALERNGFFGPGSWYMNHDRNVVYSARAVNGGRLNMPVLFLHAANDLTCDTTGSRLAEPMREYCANLAEVVIQSGHLMAQECPVAVNAALAKWLAVKVPDFWAS
jgi:pimeloyl-ACP methyl ester carboxylesterase